MRCSVDGARCWLGLASLLVMGAAVAALSARIAVAVSGNTQVQALVCGSGGGNPTLNITTPQSDTVITELPLQVAGGVSNASQIDVSVDGNYHATVPLSSGQTSYSLSMQLSAGTHTVQLVANDICGVQNASDGFVITYQPPPPSSTGTAPSPTSRQTVTGQTLTEGESLLNNGISPTARVGHLLDGLATALDFDTTARDGGIGTALARFIAFAAGLFLLIAGRPLLWAVSGYILAAMGRPRPPDTRRPAAWYRWRAWGTGLAFLLVALVL